MGSGYRNSIRKIRVLQGTERVSPSIHLRSDVLLTFDSVEDKFGREVRTGFSRPRARCESLPIPEEQQ